MTGQPPGATGSRVVDRAIAAGRVGPADLVDAGFVVGTGALALWGFASSFDSPAFLVPGTVGLVLGVAVAHIGVAVRRGWPVTAMLGLAAYLLLGPVVAMRSEAIGGVLPGPAVLGRLAAVAVHGWTEFLTTLPPVDASGQFLALCYLLGLLTGVIGYGWARGSTHMAWPVAVPVAAFTLVLLLGTVEPVAPWPRGLALAAGCGTWVALRRRRLVRIVGTGTRSGNQIIVGSALLAGALGLAVLGGQLTAAPADRFVLRSLIQPPFDMTTHPSPLVGFRLYTQGAQRLWGQPLLTVTGLAAGERVRIAVLDDYSGTVWSTRTPVSRSSGGFRRVGTSIAAAPGEPHTTERAVTIRIHSAYAGLNGVNLWVPGIGSARRITFTGPDAAALSGTVRYDTTTGQAVVSQRLRDQDRIRLVGRPVAVVPAAGVVPGGGDLVDPGVADFAAAAAARLAGTAATEPWKAVATAGAMLRQQGAYSDGTATGELQYLPGHGAGRLKRFLTARQFVGNDEQYASAFALVANALGVPARVVLGAVVPAGGVVEGKDVRAWVEVKDAEGQWFAMPNAMFMPDRDKRPSQDPPPAVAQHRAADVPPPNAERPPGALDSLLPTRPPIGRPLSPAAAGVPAWLRQVAAWVGVPLAVLVLVIGGIALTHGVRARRRRHTGTASRRFAHGWTELVDRARDLGTVVPAGLTRRQQCQIIGFPELAAQADAVVFGAAEPSPEAIDRYWQATGLARRSLTRDASRPRRVLRRFTLTSLLFRDPRPVEEFPAPAPPRRSLPRGARPARSGA